MGITEQKFLTFSTPLDGGMTEKWREGKSYISYCVMEQSGGWLTTRCAGCLEHHGNRERKALRGAAVQGLHLFRQHFNYFGHQYLEKLMHSRLSATNWIKPQRFCSLYPCCICEITITIGNAVR